MVASSEGFKTPPATFRHQQHFADRNVSPQGYKQRSFQGAASKVSPPATLRSQRFFESTRLHGWKDVVVDKICKAP